MGAWKEHFWAYARYHFEFGHRSVAGKFWLTGHKMRYLTTTQVQSHAAIGQRVGQTTISDRTF